ncbi:hypothetical protein DFS33DRAFT_1447398 [Desarmillaria ectypa]|nr:hypothetical protein DFS33DRAFT_1447398 [Desarmillaria ectypa]
MALPQDILEEILSHLRFDFPSLKTCSLTHSSFLRPTNRLLFAKILAQDFRGPPADICLKLRKVLVVSKYMAASIRSLVMNFFWYPEESGTGIFPSLLQLLPNLHRFFIYLSRANISMFNADPFPAPHSISSVRTLILGDIVFDAISQLYSLLASFKNLEVITMDVIWINDASATADLVPSRQSCFPSTLELNLNGPVMEALLSLQSTVSIANLRVLSILAGSGREVIATSSILSSLARVSSLLAVFEFQPKHHTTTYCTKFEPRSSEYSCSSRLNLFSVATIYDPKMLADLRFQAATCLKLLVSIQTEEFTCARISNERMVTHDRSIAEANRQRSNDTRLGLLMALKFLARCFCLGEQVDYVAAVFGQPRQQEASENVLADDNVQNDSNCEEEEDEGGSHFVNPALGLPELSMEISSFGSVGDDIVNFELENLQSLHGSPTLLPSAELEDSLETQNSSPSTTPCKSPLVLIVSNHKAHDVPSYFKSTSQLVKQASLHCILRPDITEQWFYLIILGRECCSSWLDQRFSRLLKSLSFGDNDDTAIPGTGPPSHDVENHIDEWTRRGGTELDGMATKQKDALIQLLSHFPSIDHATSGSTVICSLFRTIISLIFQHQNGKEVNLARDKTSVSHRSFVALILAMSILGDSAFMLNIGRCPMSVSLSDSESQNVRLRRFRRRWLRIVSLARGARNVAEVGVPMIISYLDCSDDPAWNRPRFENDFLRSDKYFQILWADRVLPPPKIKTAESPPPLEFIGTILQQAQPSRQKEGVARLMEEWKDTPILSAWTRGTKWDVRIHAELQLQ